jgi:hypothetical protein
MNDTANVGIRHDLHGSTYKYRMENIREERGDHGDSAARQAGRCGTSLAPRAAGGCVMKVLSAMGRIISIITVIGLFLVLRAPAVAYAGTTASDRVLTGELVVTNAARNQFRLVEQRGSFTAPAGTALEALEGKPVEVELGRNGRVLRISQMPIHFEPITHGFDVISGELVLRDPVTRTFSIAGDNRTYVAPYRINIGQYAGQMVQMRIDEQGRIMDITSLARAADAPVLRSLSECRIGDASVATGSSICRSGRTFRCATGQWVNLGTPCSW